jgi:hypothetical protein
MTTDYFEEEFLSRVAPVLFTQNTLEVEMCIVASPSTASINSILHSRNPQVGGSLQGGEVAQLDEALYVFKDKNLDRLFEPVTSKRGKLM